MYGLPEASGNGGAYLKLHNYAPTFRCQLEFVSWDLQDKDMRMASGGSLPANRTLRASAFPQCNTIEEETAEGPSASKLLAITTVRTTAIAATETSFVSGMEWSFYDPLHLPSPPSPAISHYEKRGEGSGNAASPIPSTGEQGRREGGLPTFPPHPGALVAGGKRGGSGGTIKDGWWQS